MHGTVGNPQCNICGEKILEIEHYYFGADYAHAYCCDRKEKGLKRRKAEKAVDDAYERNRFDDLRCAIHH